MKNKGLWVVVSVLMVLGLLMGGFGCKTPEPTSEPTPTPTPTLTPLEPVKIGYLYWKTGPAAGMGLRDFMGFKVAVKEINDAGGILGGRKIEYTEYDMGYSADAISAAFKKAVADGADTIIGFLETGTSVLGTQLGKEYGIPVAVAGGTGTVINKAGYKGYVHCYINPRPDWSSTINWMENRGVKTVVEVNWDAVTSHAVSDFLYERWDKPGSPVEILDSIWAAPDQMDISVEMTKAIAQNPDFITLMIWGPGLASAVSTAKELGYEGGLMPTRSVVYPEEIALDPDLWEGLYAQEGFFPDPSVPANAAYVKAHQEMWGPDIVPLMVGVVDYLAVNIMLRAMDKAGTTSDLDKIYDAMMTLEWTTPMGEPLKILPDGQVFFSKMALTQVQDGKLVLIQDVPVDIADYYWWEDEPESIWWE